MTADATGLIDRKCPLCGNPDGRIQVRAPIRASEIGTDERADYWRGFRSRSCFFDYARCPKCEILYCPEYFDHEQLEDLYASMEDNTAGASPDVLRRTQAGYINFLHQHASFEGTYLEIGPDIGLATEAAVARGNFEHLVLVEPNRDVHQQLGLVAGDLPATIVSSLDDLNDTPRADIGVLVHVLDHLLDPVEFLSSLRSEYLRPGATVVAVVHNEGSLLRRIMGLRWPPFCLQHPQLYSGASLEKVFVKAGYKILGGKPTTNVFPLRHLAKTGGELIGLRGNWSSHLPDATIRLRLGNIMVAAQA